MFLPFARAVSLFISNLSPETLRVKPESMFWRVGKIMDTFISVDRKTGKKRYRFCKIQD